jgi:pyruvate, water dikinase
VRMSDFKSNEYASLLGGADFELQESNPMIGFRGSSRYAHPAYAEGFALECKAMRRVREEMGLTNVVLMLPFVRRVAEAEQVLDRMAELGLRRGENGLKIYAMCEIPNNVMLIGQVFQTLRRLLHRLERPDSAHPWRRSRQRDRRVRLRRA